MKFKKTEKKRPISLFRQSHSTPGPFRANSTRVRLRGFVLCPYFRDQCEKMKVKKARLILQWGIYYLLKYFGRHGLPSSGSYEKTRRHDRRKFFPVGGTVWYMDRLTNHSKPRSIGQKHSHCFANYSKSVVIGYSGRKLPWELLTIVYKGKSPPEVLSFVLVDLPIRVHR